MQAWLYGEGTRLPVEIEYDISLAEPAYRLASRWDAARDTPDASQLDFDASDVASFNSNQKSKPLHPSLPPSALPSTPSRPSLSFSAPSRVPRAPIHLRAPPLHAHRPPRRALRPLDVPKRRDPPALLHRRPPRPALRRRARVRGARARAVREFEAL